MSIRQICDVLEMSQSSLYGHMLILRDHAACSWRAAGNKTIIVAFPLQADGHSKNLENAPGAFSKNLESSARNGSKNRKKAGSAHSRNLEKPIHISVSPLERKTTEGEGGFQKSGKSPAVEAFRSAAQSWPARAQWPAITAAVGDEPAQLELWGRVVAGYILKGYNPRNVAGMLDFFSRGEVPGASNGHGTPLSNLRLPDGV